MDKSDNVTENISSMLKPYDHVSSDLKDMGDYGNEDFTNRTFFEDDNDFELRVQRMDSISLSKSRSVTKSKDDFISN